MWKKQRKTSSGEKIEIEYTLVTKLAYWYQVTNQGVVYQLALQEEQCRTEI